MRQLKFDFEAEERKAEEAQPPQEPKSKYLDGPINKRVYAFSPHRHIDWLYDLYQQDLKACGYNHAEADAKQIRLERWIPNPDYDPNDPNSLEYIPNDELQLWYRDNIKRKLNPPTVGG